MHLEHMSPSLRLTVGLDDAVDGLTLQAEGCLSFYPLDLSTGEEQHHGLTFNVALFLAPHHIISSVEVCVRHSDAASSEPAAASDTWQSVNVCVEHVARGCSCTAAVLCNRHRESMELCTAEEFEAAASPSSPTTEPIPSPTTDVPPPRRRLRLVLTPLASPTEPSVEGMEEALRRRLVSADDLRKSCGVELHHLQLPRWINEGKVVGFRLHYQHRDVATPIQQTTPIHGQLLQSWRVAGRTSHALLIGSPQFAGELSPLVSRTVKVEGRLRCCCLPVLPQLEEVLLHPGVVGKWHLHLLEQLPSRVSHVRFLFRPLPQRGPGPSLQRNCIQNMHTTTRTIITGATPSQQQVVEYTCVALDWAPLLPPLHQWLAQELLHWRQRTATRPPSVAPWEREVHPPTLRVVVAAGVRASRGCVASPTTLVLSEEVVRCALQLSTRTTSSCGAYEDGAASMRAAAALLSSLYEQQLLLELDLRSDTRVKISSASLGAIVHQQLLAASLARCLALGRLRQRAVSDGESIWPVVQLAREDGHLIQAAAAAQDRGLPRGADARTWFHQLIPGSQVEAYMIIAYECLWLWSMPSIQRVLHSSRAGAWRPAVELTFAARTIHAPQSRGAGNDDDDAKHRAALRQYALDFVEEGRRHAQELRHSCSCHCCGPESNVFDIGWTAAAGLSSSGPHMHLQWLGGVPEPTQPTFSRWPSLRDSHGILYLSGVVDARLELPQSEEAAQSVAINLHLRSVPQKPSGGLAGEDAVQWERQLDLLEVLTCFVLLVFEVVDGDDVHEEATVRLVQHTLFSWNIKVGACVRGEAQRTTLDVSFLTVPHTELELEEAAMSHMARMKESMASKKRRGRAQALGADAPNTGTSAYATDAATVGARYVPVLVVDHSGSSPLTHFDVRMDGDGFWKPLRTRGEAANRQRGPRKTRKVEADDGAMIQRAAGVLLHVAAHAIASHRVTATSHLGGVEYYSAVLNGVLEVVARLSHPRHKADDHGTYNAAWYQQVMNNSLASVPKLWAATRRLSQTEENTLIEEGPSSSEVSAMLHTLWFVVLDPWLYHLVRDFSVRHGGERAVSAATWDWFARNPWAGKADLALAKLRELPATAPLTASGEAAEGMPGSPTSPTTASGQPGKRRVLSLKAAPVVSSPEFLCAPRINSVEAVLEKCAGVLQDEEVVSKSVAEALALPAELAVLSGRFRAQQRDLMDLSSPDNGHRSNQRDLALLLAGRLCL